MTMTPLRRVSHEDDILTVAGLDRLSSLWIQQTQVTYS